MQLFGIRTFSKTFVLIFGLALIGAVNPAHADTLLGLSDIHFVPFETCAMPSTDDNKPCPLIQELVAAPVSSWGNIFKKEVESPINPPGQETNFALWEQTLSFAKSTVHPRFIFLGGDFLGHDYETKYALYSQDTSESGYENFVQKTMVFLISEIHQTFPGVPVFFTLGNNDSYSGDYVSDPNGKFYQDMGRFGLPLFQGSIPNTADFFTSFDSGAYYAAQLGSQQELIVLNSVLFSAKGSVPVSNSVTLQQSASEELSWLDQTLSTAERNHENVWILMHIPDVIDDYASKKAGYPVELWSDPYNPDFLSLLEKYHSTIKLIFTGHFHRDGSYTYALPDAQTGKTLDLLDTYLPGLDSTHGNQPGFKTYEFDEKSFAVSSMNLYEFTNRKFQETYSKPLS